MAVMRCAASRTHIRRSKLVSALTTALVLAGVSYFAAHDPVEPLKAAAAEPLLVLEFETFVPEAKAEEPPTAPEPEPLKTLIAEKSDFEAPVVEKKEKPPKPEAKPEEPKPQVPPPEVKKEPKPEPQPEVKPEPPKPKAVEPKKKEEPKPAPKKPETKKEPVKKPAPKEKAQAPKTQGVDGNGTSKTSKNETEVRGNTDKVNKKNLIATKLFAMVEKRKRYPRAARRSGQEGVVELKFTVTGDGKVTKAVIARECQFPVLNGAVEEIGNKLIGADLEIQGAASEIIIPVRFALQ